MKSKIDMSALSLHPKVPKYLKLVESLRSQIVAGALSPGERLPSVAEIQAAHSISQSTVDKAHALLEQEGLIVREQGRGTFVAEPAPPQDVRTLGLWMRAPSIGNIYMIEVWAGIRTEASRRDLRLVWLDCSKPFDAAGADAILLCCEPNEALALPIPSHLPHVLLFHNHPDFTCIVADDFSGGKLATQYLIELGHRRIACLPSSDYDYISRHRLAGYREAMDEAGLPVEDGFVKFLNAPREAGYRKGGELLMQNWLWQDWDETGCTALVAHNDDTAIGAIKALSAQGFRVPEDVSVIGFDGTAIGEMCVPPLTTISIPLQGLGASAVEVLCRQNPNIAMPPKVVLPVELIRRESTASLMTENVCSHL
jgi:DNA-binding LacI/PurR family transcriptional regulator